MSVGAAAWAHRNCRSQGSRPRSPSAQETIKPRSGATSGLSGAAGRQQLLPSHRPRGRGEQCRGRQCGEGHAKKAQLVGCLGSARPHPPPARSIEWREPWLHWWCEARRASSNSDPVFGRARRGTTPALSLWGGGCFEPRSPPHVLCGCLRPPVLHRRQSDPLDNEVGMGGAKPLAPTSTHVLFGPTRAGAARHVLSCGR